MAELDVEVPIVAATLFSREEYFNTIHDSMNVTIFVIFYAPHAPHTYCSITFFSAQLTFRRI